MSYFSVWSALGIIIFPFGIAIATATMQQPLLARAVPIIVAVVVLIAGALQFSKWKIHQLACCKAAPINPLPENAGAAWRYGVRLGLRCVHCCANLSATLLVIGVMDLRAMAAVTIAIGTERLAPNGELAARAVGIAIVAAGLWLAARAVF